MNITNEMLFYLENPQILNSSDIEISSLKENTRTIYKNQYEFIKHTIQLYYQKPN